MHRPEQLRREADTLLERVNLLSLVSPYGRVVFTGSYYLNVMVYPDLDLYLPLITLPQLFTIAAQIAECKLVTQVVYEPSDDPVNLPGGLYLKARFNYGEWGRPWKIDMWCLPQDVIRRKMAEMEHFREKLSPEIREKIIQYKLSILTLQHRTPMYSGYYIYKAFIDENLEDYERVTHYLEANGIHMETH
ncbi:MAG: hypothetical protein C3F13_13620 [Anaerolineales bacterium]|nr:MAG: hypothetical protein C3F13_13620 [Anaerolineales bacterium]